jgi:hypothetical protein
LGQLSTYLASWDTVTFALLVELRLGSAGGDGLRKMVNVESRLLIMLGTGIEICFNMTKEFGSVCSMILVTQFMERDLVQLALCIR